MTEDEKPTIFKDIRRYYCEFCGICRSKKTLITAHILSNHKEEMPVEKDDEKEGSQEAKANKCDQCGACFRKPAYLKQHMQSHQLERPYTCSVDDCHASYRRKDHLTRHFLQHEGKLFKCPIENCSREFIYQGNVKRHVEELHGEDAPVRSSDGQKQFVCSEIGCGKAFKFLSKLRKHEDSHVTLDSVEAFCSEPGCMKYFSNESCLRAHINSCHQYILCEICGTKQLKKNIKRHLHTHEAAGTTAERIKCHFEGCLHTFSTSTNLKQHVKAVHLEIKPFACGFPRCGKTFSYKHVRDKHEKSGCHVYTPGDFEESDELFRSKPRGGRKRTCPTVEMLIRKRVSLPTESDECHTWLHSMQNQDLSSDAVS